MAFRSLVTVRHPEWVVSDGTWNLIALQRFTGMCLCSEVWLHSKMKKALSKNIYVATLAMGEVRISARFQFVSNLQRTYRLCSVRSGFSTSCSSNFSYLASLTVNGAKVGELYWLHWSLTWRVILLLLHILVSIQLWVMFHRSNICTYRQRFSIHSTIDAVGYHRAECTAVTARKGNYIASLH